VGLSRLNPLFIDSTKPVGDKLVTSIELINLLLYDGDTLFFEFLDPIGTAQKIVMQSFATKKAVKYNTEIWLNSQQKIKYRFMIESKDQKLYLTKYQFIIAGVAIVAQWEPICTSPTLPYQNNKPSIRKKTQLKSAAPNGICDPAYFANLKILIDDLV
jgi:hypothetical protein